MEINRRDMMKSVGASIVVPTVSKAGEKEKPKGKYEPISITVCTSCKKQVPEECDGVIYKSVNKCSPGKEHWIGCQHYWPIIHQDGKIYFKVTMGHGCTYLAEIKRISV